MLFRRDFFENEVLGDVTGLYVDLKNDVGFL